MRGKLGTILMGFGVLLVLAALALFLNNQWEDLRAGTATKTVLPQVIEQIGKSQSPESAQDLTPPNEMKAIMIDGYAYIGYLSIPSLGLELPVMSDWDYDRLKLAPCRYAGTPRTNDFVIAAHNYTRHFGPLDRLQAGDAVEFTDMEGETYRYTVTVVDILAPTSVEEMTSGAYDLSLFTCTYDGQTRLTVRCDRS